MVDLENIKWPESPLKAKELDAEQIKQFLSIRADYEKSAFVTAGHLEVRQLGVKEFTNPIPPGECAVKALVSHPNGHIYGGTGGNKPHLFYYNPAPDADGCADIGTLAPDGEVAAMTVLQNGKILAAVNRSGKEGKGELYLYSPCEIVLRDADFSGMGVREIFDLPAEDQLFFSTIDPCHSAGKIEQLPSLPGEKIADLTELDGKIILLGRESGTLYRFLPGDETAEKIGRLDPNGNFSQKIVRCGDAVYAAGLYGRLFRYSAGRGLEILPVTAPSLKGRELYNKVTAWSVAPEGVLYGGTVDGIIFSYVPETGEKRTFGKATDQCNVCAMSISGKKVYALVGNPSDCCHLTVFDSETRDLLDLGALLARSERPWNGYCFSSMVTGNNGVVYMGESDRISHLFIFFPPVC